MRLPDATILRIINQAFDHAVATPVDPTTPLRTQNQTRSQNWVACLRDEFERTYRRANDNRDVRALCKQCGDNRSEFGLNELLHDVSLFRVATVPSRIRAKPLTYVTDVLWQAESEFANSGSAAIADFNKLILGSARQKLFVGGIGGDPEADLAILTQPAKCCSGEIYVALVEHPHRWVPNPRRPRLYRFVNEREWRPVLETAHGLAGIR